MAPEAWDLPNEHFAERFQLFVIIALGESIVVTGATTSQLELTPARVIAFAIAFLGTAALWWLYFNFVATLAERALERAERRTLLARNAYTYLHIVIIAGILLSAVGDEIVIAHPTDELSAAELAVVVGGPAVYLLAQAAVRLRVTGMISLRRIGGAASLLRDRADRRLRSRTVRRRGAVGRPDRRNRRRSGRRRTTDRRSHAGTHRLAPTGQERRARLA